MLALSTDTPQLTSSEQTSTAGRGAQCTDCPSCTPWLKSSHSIRVSFHEPKQHLPFLCLISSLQFSRSVRSRCPVTKTRWRCVPCAIRPRGMISPRVAVRATDKFSISTTSTSQCGLPCLANRVEFQVLIISK